MCSGDKTGGLSVQTSACSPRRSSMSLAMHLASGRPNTQPVLDALAPHSAAPLLLVAATTTKTTFQQHLFIASHAVFDRIMALQLPRFKQKHTVKVVDFCHLRYYCLFHAKSTTDSKVICSKLDLRLNSIVTSYVASRYLCSNKLK